MSVRKLWPEDSMAMVNNVKQKNKENIKANKNPMKSIN